MKKTTALKALNPVLAVLIVSQLTTGILHSRIPHEVYEIVHAGAGYVLAAGVAVHLALNWSWVKAGYFRRKES